MKHRWYLGKNIEVMMGIEGGNGHRKKRRGWRAGGMGMGEGETETETGHSGKRKQKQKNEIQSVKIQSRIG